MLNTRFWVLVAITASLAASRLMNHPWNFTPVTAMALFGGAFFASKRAAFAVPMLALFVSDLALNALYYGFYPFQFLMMPFSYGCFALAVALGLWLRGSKSLLRLELSTLTASVLFFLVTNFGFWLFDTTLSRDVAGLTECYRNGLPFFRRMLAGDQIYTLALFGSFALAQRYLPSLRETTPSPALEPAVA